jgi:hypothetical protein
MLHQGNSNGCFEDIFQPRWRLLAWRRANVASTAGSDPL